MASSPRESKKNSESFRPAYETEERAEEETAEDFYDINREAEGLSPAHSAWGWIKNLARRCREMCRTWYGEPRFVWQKLGLLLIFGALWFFLGRFGIVPAGDFPSVSEAKWQAVFLTNNQVYFGHLQNYDRGYAALRGIYYLQAQPPVQPEQAAPNMNLVKFGSELHGPEDMMFIPKNQILFWENMRADSQVVRTIENAKK